MMTKYKLDDILQATPAPKLDGAKLSAMVERALSEPQDKEPVGAKILQFPRPTALWGSAGATLAAACLVLVLNVGDGAVSSADLMFTQEEMEMSADFFLLDTLDV